MLHPPRQTMQTDEVRICFEWGFLGWALVSAALTWGRGLWLGLSWYAVRVGELYWLMATATGIASWAAQYVVATVLLDGTPPFPECNNNIRAAPDLAVWLLYHYWTLTVVHERYVGIVWASWWTCIYRVAVGVAIPVILVVTGNTTWAYAAYGVGFGVAMGLLSAVLLTVVWAPRIPAVAQYTAQLGITTHCDDAVARLDAPVVVRFSTSA